MNVVTSSLTAEQQAFLNMTGKGSKIGSDLTVKSLLNHAEAKAVTGPPAAGKNKDVKITLVGIDVNTADAYAATKNKAFIKGGSYTVGQDVAVSADTDSKADAEAKTAFTVSLATVGSMMTNAHTNDLVEAYTENVNIKAVGDVDVTAKGNTVSHALSENGGNIGVSHTSYAEADASVGTFDKATDGTFTKDIPQSVSAGISGGVIEAGGNVNVLAKNAGTVDAQVQKGLVISAKNVTITRLPTHSYYKTDSYIKGGADVTAGGDISVKANDRPVATSIADGMTIGFGINANFTMGENEIYTDNTVEVNGSLTAEEGIAVVNDSNAVLDSKTNAAGGGFFSGDTLWAKNRLYRTGKITIGDNSTLKANYGDIDILNNGGTSDNIKTKAMIDTAGAVDLGTIQTEVDVKNDLDIVIGSGVKIFDRFNTVTIRSDASIEKMDINSSADCSGFPSRAFSHEEGRESPEISVCTLPDARA